MKLILNEDISHIMNVFASNGFEVFLVGGCVRDMIMGLEPHDFDFTTNARPEQVHDVFREYKIIDTGIKHGTVTLVYNGETYEITTYRKETEYDDHRHPSSITYSDNVYEDLIRRDFTVNAMAYNPEYGLIDYFDGLKDIENRIIRCVGNPDERFNEDALRILRAIRFATRFDFTIETATENALIKNRDLLKYISLERITSEFNEIICSDKAAEYIDRYRDVIAVFMPEIKIMFDFDQNSRYHCHDLWKHSLLTLQTVKPTVTSRWAALLHDIGKPDVRTTGKDGRYHYVGHPVRSEEIALKILRRMHFDKKTLKYTCDLIRNHDYDFNSDGKIKLVISEYGHSFYQDLIDLKRADNMAHHPDFVNERSYYDMLAEKGAEFRDNILHMSDMKINGDDIRSVGITGPAIGKALYRAYKKVLEGTVKNDHDILINYVKSLNLKK
ncbi:MAG: CCA tRNA nucleotidyltransferase [Erysipelotrichaceae bacterium]|nr:CCA tRNA nucleotidyltransferase [Erysipelotrichaceae bacterium]